MYTIAIVPDCWDCFWFITPLVWFQIVYELCTSASGALGNLILLGTTVKTLLYVAAV